MFNFIYTLFIIITTKKIKLLKTDILLIDGFRITSDLTLYQLKNNSMILIGKLLNSNSISMGVLHSTIILEDYSLLVIGSNGDGQLGFENIKESHTPIDTGMKCIEAQCGHKHTVALDMHGNLFTTGNNKFFQLGTGDCVNRKEFTLIKTGVTSIGKIDENYTIIHNGVTAEITGIFNGDVIGLINKSNVIRERFTRICSIKEGEIVEYGLDK